MKQNIGRIAFLVITIPIIVMLFGMYEDNVYLVYVGLILFFIVSIILFQYLKKLKYF